MTIWLIVIRDEPHARAVLDRAGDDCGRTCTCPSHAAAARASGGVRA
jgi:hypothetical protein